MHNITQEDRYKEAVRSKFEKERSGGYSNYLSNPSQASLRDLCWKIFKLDPTASDLKVYFDFFKFEFDSINENTGITYTNKFKKVGAFLRGDKKPAKMDTVNFAAILVDFEPRPYNNFNNKKVVAETQEHKPIGNTNDPKSEVEGNHEVTIRQGITIKEDPYQKRRFIERLLKLLKKSKRTIYAILFIFGLAGTGTAIYLAFFKKDNMQWSKDHYEVVYKEGIAGNPNEIIDYDEHLLDFKKVSVCDTTTCFKPDGEAIVWYAKTGDRADFFNSNGNGRHPETKRSLRPITQYIKGKYKGDCPTK